MVLVRNHSVALVLLGGGTPLEGCNLSQLQLGNNHLRSQLKMLYWMKYPRLYLKIIGDIYIYIYIHYITSHHIALHYITLHYITYRIIHTDRQTYTYIHTYIYTYEYIRTYVYMCNGQVTCNEWATVIPASWTGFLWMGILTPVLTMAHVVIARRLKAATSRGQVSQSWAVNTVNQIPEQNCLVADWMNVEYPLVINRDKGK